jgi:hypothetical protein
MTNVAFLNGANVTIGHVTVKGTCTLYGREVRLAPEAQASFAREFLPLILLKPFNNRLPLLDFGVDRNVPYYY